MATVAPVILKDDKKQDGTWNVKIRVGHKTKSSYADTVHFVSKNQLNYKFKIKDQFLLDLIEETILKDYRRIISELGDSIDSMTAVELRKKLESEMAKGREQKQNSSGEIDFICFCRSHIQKMKDAGKESSTKPLITVVNSLIDYFKSEYLPVTEINANFLFAYESYLKSDRELKRVNQLGKVVTTTSKGLGKAGLHNHMRDLRLLFNKCREQYNDEDLGIMRIMHYPFKKYKVGRAPETEKRALTVIQIKAIRDVVVEPGSRSELARDLFMLSFYLCGMNAADLYELNAGIDKKSRLEYKRSKTRDKRQDEAFISIKIIPEAKPLLKKYAGSLQERYSATSGLNTALDKGITALSEKLNFNFDFYSARHSFGTLGRNECRFSTDDIALAMNHTENRVTDIYIKKDWSIVDEVQAGVVGLLYKKEIEGAI